MGELRLVECGLFCAMFAAACAAPPGTPRSGGGSAALIAPEWVLAAEGSGTWDEAREDEHRLVRGWVDAHVANVRYHKRVFVEVLAPYAGGSEMRTLYEASYRATGADGRERWGTDEIEVYPEGGPHGASLDGPVRYRISMQHTVDGEERMVRTPWQWLYGDGAMPDTDEPFDAPLALRPVPPVEAPAPVEVYFSPFDDPGQRVLSEIDALIEARRRDPAVRRTLHAAVFNVHDPEIVDRLIAAHRAGVEVRLLIDGRKLRPWYGWHQGDDRLLAAGVPVLGVRRPGGGAMHDKVAIFDGRRVMTGSMNWEHGARHENHENVVVLEAPDVVEAYARRLHALAGGVAVPRRAAADPDAALSVSFAPDEDPTRIIGDLIDGAAESVHVAMFTCKDVRYTRRGVETSLFERLAAAVERGVHVVVLIDHGIHEASEYHGIVSEDDPADERLEAMGVRVVRADNTFGPYASMHHKFAVIDHEVVVTGAFNWYHDAAYLNDEDQLVLRDATLARRFEGELVDLLRRYDPDYDAGEWPLASLEVEAFHDGTTWGERVVLVGDLPELGAWDPAAGVELRADRWPTWAATIELPAGVRARFKLVTIGADGVARWEPGADRTLSAADGVLALRVSR